MFGRSKKSKEVEVVEVAEEQVIDSVIEDEEEILEYIIEGDVDEFDIPEGYEIVEVEEIIEETEEEASSFDSEEDIFAENRITYPGNQSSDLMSEEDLEPVEVEEVIEEVIEEPEEDKEELEEVVFEDVEPVEEIVAEEAEIVDESEEPIIDESEVAEESVEENESEEPIIDESEVAEESVEENDTEETKKKTTNNKNKLLTIGLVILLAAAALGFGLYKMFASASFSEVTPVGDTIKNDSVECVVKHAIVTDKINSVKAAEGKTFVCIDYTCKNTTKNAITWKELPYIKVGVFDGDETGKRAKTVISNEAVNKEALQQFSYFMGVDLSNATKDLDPGKEREDIDVFEVDKTIFDNNSVYITFDIFSNGIKVTGKEGLPTLKQTIKENKKK